MHYILHDSCTFSRTRVSSAKNLWSILVGKTSEHDEEPSKNKNTLVVMHILVGVTVGDNRFHSFVTNTCLDKIHVSARCVFHSLSAILN